MMRPPSELRLLFPTDFSIASGRVGPAIAQMAATCRIDLTIAHVVKPGLRSLGTHRALEAVFSGRDGGRPCRRVVIEGTEPSAAIAELCRRDRYDLVMAPAAAGGAIREWLRPSFRARLLKQCGVPLWTVGARLPAATVSRRIGRIACLVDFDSPGHCFLRLVAAFVRRFEARLHLVAVVPPTDEAVLAEVLTTDAPLLPERAVAAIQDMCPGDVAADVDVAVGSRGRELARLMARRPPDLLFVSRRQWASRGWAFRFSRHLDRLPCPVVCLDDAAEEFAGWSFAERPAYHLTSLPLSAASGVAS